MSLATEPKKTARLATLGMEKISRFRASRMKLLAHYRGKFYKADNSQIETETKPYPINLIYQAATTLIPNLVYADPRASISTQYLAYRPYADSLSLATNHLVREINLRESLRKIITDAIFMAGFVKTGLGVSYQTLDIDGWLADVGQPYADRVDPDDMILDPLARVWDEQRIIGNRYRVSVEDLEGLEGYDVDKIRTYESRYRYLNSSGHPEASYLSLKQNVATEADQLFNEVDLVDVYIPEEQVILTMPWGSKNQIMPEIVRTVEYQGPEQGPYEMLGFAYIPDNILPVAPAMVWHDLHIMTNKVATKAAKQAERSKRILAYESSAWEDAQDIIDAEDGETVRVDDVEAVKELQYAGPTEDMYAYMAWAKQQYSEMAMNIDLLSGTGSDEPTATQAEMVQANTSVRLADMQNMVYQFTAKIMERLAFFLHTDPLIELPLVKRVNGIDQQIVYSPEMREGDWIDYHLKVTPYSMARQDPNVKVRRIIEFTGQVIPALAQAYQMLGPAFNIEATLSILGREMGIDELDEMINSPVLQQQISRMQELLAQGIPLDPKVIKQITGAGITQGGSPGVADMALARPSPNPNPAGMVGTDVTPDTEMNQIHQERAAELQSTYL